MFKMAGFKSLSIIILLGCIFSNAYSARQYTYNGEIESLRNDNIITIITNEKIEINKYYIIINKKKAGTFTVIDVIKYSNRYRIIAILNKLDNKISAGTKIGFIEDKKKLKADYPDRIIKREIYYKNISKSLIDKKEMVLVDKGKCIIGSDSNDKDEFPAHVQTIPAFYIDKYEVSNQEYYYYMSQTGAPAPKIWGKKTYEKGFENIPVLVSYSEAMAYAKWAGKILPKEEFWEKAASSTDKYTRVEIQDGYVWILYPKRFSTKDNKYIVCTDYFKDSKLKIELKPVNYNEKYNVSAFGAVNMSGNAPEWTSSWYKEYPGNNYSNRLFGEKLKVVRGGGWYSPRTNCRITDRTPGGYPDLENDNCAGFRCIKLPDENDVLKK